MFSPNWPTGPIQSSSRDVYTSPVCGIFFLWLLRDPKNSIYVVKFVSFVFFPVPLSYLMMVLVILVVEVAVVFVKARCVNGCKGGE